MSRIERFVLLFCMVAIAVGTLGTFYWTRVMVIGTSQVMFPAMGDELSGGQSVSLRPPGPLPPQHRMGTPTPWQFSPLNPEAHSPTEPPRHDL